MVEFERCVKKVLGTAFLHHFHLGDVLAHLNHTVVQAGVDDVDFFNQRAYVANPAERVAFQRLRNLLELCLKSLFLRFRKDTVGHQPDHQTLIRIMIESLGLREVGLSAVRAFPHEQ